MITTLDTISWSSELVTGNAEFIEVAPPGFGLNFGTGFGGGTANLSIFVVSNVRNTGAGFGQNFGTTFGTQYGFEILQSALTPPAPGPGSAFETVGSYSFPQPNLTFDPVACYDTTGTDPLIHIIGTRNTPTGPTTSSNQTSDVIKFTFNTVTGAVSGPIVLSSGTRIRSAYDIAVLPSGDQIAVFSLTDPAIQGATTITDVSIESGVATLTFLGEIVPFVPGQWVLLDDFVASSFLNGQIVQVISADAGEFTFAFPLPTVGFGLNFGSQFGSYNAPETGAAYAMPVGNTLLAVELGANSAEGFGIGFGYNFGDSEVVPGSATIIDSSPSRSGNAFDGVSLVPNGTTVELYYQSHPKLVTFQDQLFTIKLATVNEGFGSDFGYSFGTGTPTWSLPATAITTYTARYSDNRLTVLADGAGDRWLSQTYWSQFNHPYGVLGNVLLGTKPAGGSWTFRATTGSFSTGSVVQSTIAVSQSGEVNLVYLLQPFDEIENPPNTVAAAWPLQVATVNPANLGLTNAAGFYNNVNFTWLRGTKSLIDTGSVWAVVGEREALTVVGSDNNNPEVHTVPALPGPFTVLVNNPGFFENLGVVYAATGVPLTQVVTVPAQGEYTVEPSTGQYGFSSADTGVSVAISYSYVSSIVPSYVSLFNVPPVAALSPLSATVWRGGTFYSTDIAAITSISIANSEVTVACANDFSAGEQIALYGIANATALNGVVLTVASATPTQFTASLSAQLAASVTAQLALGFGYLFGSNFSNYSKADTGSAANLLPGALTLTSAGSTDADSDAIEFFWSENDPDLRDVTLTANGALATLSVARAVGPAARSFDVGVAAVDLYPDLVTQRHPALLISNVSVPPPPAPSEITVTFAPPGQAGFGSAFGSNFGQPVPSGSVIPIAGDQVMLYGIVLDAPPAPTLGQVSGGTLAAQPNVSVIATYVNDAGETVGSDNSILSVEANHLLTVASPGTNGSATAYNVYAGQPGSETIQTLAPQPLGSAWTEPVGGLLASFQRPPQTSTALEQALNDAVLDVTAVGATSFTAPFALAGNFGIDFGDNFNGNYSASLTGDAINEFQWERAAVAVPMNVAPTISFPAPQWGVGNVLSATLARNTQITITPTPDPSRPTTQFPVVYTGIYDPDDQVTYLWAQTGGTPLVLPNGIAGPSLTLDTNGVNINGETLSFSLTVSDGVNPPVVADFSFSVAAYNFVVRDTMQLSRSVWGQSASVTEVTVSAGVATVVANNSFLPGEPVAFTGLTGASFLNSVGGLFVKTATSTQFTVVVTLPDYPATPDSGTASVAVPISQRNLPQVWSPLDISVVYSDLISVKRVSVLDGSDRYIVISPYSVLVYGVYASANPVAVLLRKLYTPAQTPILDAVHAEQDYTLVLDNAGNVFRYSSAPLIETDNPDTTLVLADITSIGFTDPDLIGDVKIMTTQSFANNRVVVLSGPNGAVLLQLNTTTLATNGILEFLTSDNLLYGADAIQFVRWVDMDNLHTGEVLLGSVAYNSARITQVAISSNTLIITAANGFSVGDMVVLSNMLNATFLNGATVKVISASATSFAASYEYAGSYGPTVEAKAVAEALTSGTTYETLVSLTQGQIVGTWDKSKLINQFVQTGEILFTPDTTYAGAPIPPVLAQPTSAVSNGQTLVTLSWQQERPDLINSYTVSYAIETQVVSSVPSASPYTVQVPNTYTFTADEGVVDSASLISITSAQVSGNVVTIAGTNSFSPGQSVQINGLTGLTALIGQSLTVATASPTQFTAAYTHADYGLPASVANVEVLSNVLTIQTTVTHTFLPGTQVSFSGVGIATFLNGQTVTILTVGASTFTASFTHANYGPLADTGSISDADTGNGTVALNAPLVAVASNPQAGQYTVSETGLYTFNAAQAGNTVTISIRQSFNTLQNVSSGATQSIVVPLAAGKTYFFVVEAFGLDGASGLSNIVSVSI